MGEYEDKFVNFKKYDFFVSDWSGLFIEYAILFKRKSYLINTSKKILNENYKKYSTLPIEISLRNILCKTYDTENLNKLAEEIFIIKENFSKSNFEKHDHNIKKIIDDNFY